MRISSITKNAGKACNNRLYRHIRTFEKIVKNYFVIYFKKDGIFFAKKMQDIVYIKSSAGKMLVKTVRDSLEISYKSNSQVLRELDSENFIKCNRAVVVNKAFIASVDSTNRYITLKDGYGTLEIGTIMKKEFMKEIFE